MEQEILQVLSLELEEGGEKNTQLLNSLLDEDISFTTKSENLSELNAFVNRLADAGKIIEFDEFSQLCNFMSDNLSNLEISAQNPTNLQHIISLILSWFENLQQCLNKPDNIDLLGGLFAKCQDPSWPKPFDDAVFNKLAENFINKMLGASNDDELDNDNNKLEIDSASLSLQIDENIDSRLVDAFYVEVPDQVTALSELIQTLSEPSSTKASTDKLREAQRLAHTIKGTSNIVGLTAAATLTHLIEDVFDYLVEHKLNINHSLAEVLIESADHLEEIIASVCDNESPPENTYETLANLNEWKSIVNNAETDGADIELPLEKDTIAKEQKVKTKQNKKTTADKNPKSPPQKQQIKRESTDSIMRISGNAINLLTGLAGELSTSLIQSEGIISHSLAQIDLLTNQNSIVDKRLLSLQNLLEVKSIPVKKALLSSNKDDAGFDPLEMDEYNELHSATNTLAETLKDVREFAKRLTTSLKNMQEKQIQMENLSNEINERLISTRLTSANHLSSRLQRGVRQVAKSTGKKVELLISGDDVLVDNQVLDSIINPLLHVLRNAVSHGIENPESRKKANKKEKGQIKLSFKRQGESLLIECRDDGSGFNLENIANKAIKLGLIDQNHNLTAKELINLTLLPGFSTAQSVSQASGRGIGMDVVNRAIEDLRGNMDINSEPGRNSTIIIRLPLTLMSMHLLIFRVADSVFATPSSGLEQVLFSDAGKIIKTQSGYLFNFNEQDYEIHQFKTLLGLAVDKPIDPSANVLLMLVKVNTGNIALVFDETLNGRNLVVNQFNDYFPRMDGMIGASILGDGSIVPIIDLFDLLQKPHQEKLATVNTQTVPEIKTHKILVVDDSISARGSMVETLKNAGFLTLTAVDGMDALIKLEGEKIDAAVLDLEMPRMNGIELATHLRLDESYKQIPLLMVTSRSTEKHKKLAKNAGINAYFTKPYQEDEFTDKIYSLIEETGS